MENKRIFGTTEYDKILLNATQDLECLKRRAGGEGVAYFLGDEYVIKEFVNTGNAEMLSVAFDAYAMEMKKFKELGFNVPEIYSWVRLPGVDKRGKVMDRFFILEEKIPGRELYFGFIEDFFGMVEDWCSKKEFFNAVDYPNENMELFKKIATEYVSDYIRINELIESVPESVLEKLIMDAYNMYVLGTVSEPDLFPSNILVDGENFVIIDNKISDRSDIAEVYHPDVSEGFEELEIAQNYIVANFLNLFLYNEYIREPEKGILYFVLDTNAVGLDPLVQRNVKVCEAAILKIVKVMNHCLDNPTFTNKTLFERVRDLIVRSVGQDSAEKIMKKVNTKFEM